jgi:hypothetical protein
MPSLFCDQEGPFAEAMEQTHLSFDEVKAAWDRAQKPQQPHAIKAASLPIIAESLTSAAKHAYAATWVEGGAREHLVKLMLNDLGTAMRVMSAGLIKDGHMTANDTFAQRETRSSSVQAKARRDCFDAHKKQDEIGTIYLVCHLCEGRINPAIEPWIAEHAVRRAVGGSDAPSNVLPAHQKCAREKDRVDISENARGKRVSDKHFGIVKKRGFNRRRDMKFNWQAGRYE